MITESATLQRSIQPDQLPLDRLMGNPHVSEADKIEAVGRSFEAIFVREILKHAQKTVITSSIAKDTAASGIYQDMIRHTLADSISDSGGLGLKEIVVRDLQRLVPDSPSGAGVAGAETAEASPTHPAS